MYDIDFLNTQIIHEFFKTYHSSFLWVKVGDNYVDPVALLDA